MSSSHIYYIPLLLMVGLAVGHLLGRRSALLQCREDEMARRSREESDLAAMQEATLRAAGREDAR
ncbi:MAG: hypothetical protein CVU56_07875 [Deltaproteobacteria bacterium HGW-Deltaproteobacteria-14]|jgi:hypothetical protein|nr:MAG: hypothetical protein CVU56_07875 [Deltaproteobacteria bacterium HGW-Deltaproteobacteria-14]